MTVTVPANGALPVDKSSARVLLIEIEAGEMVWVTIVEYVWQHIGKRTSIC